MKNKISFLLCVLILGTVAATVYVNVQKELAIDHSKLPEKVESYGSFQKWITNAKNHGIDISADDFRLKEENEVYNSQWIKVYSIDDPTQKALFDKTLQEHENLQHVSWSPSKRIFIDYRYMVRGDYTPDQARLYGQKEDKILDARILTCLSEANCYFDRAYFLDNDVFVISEFSRTVNKGDLNIQPCSLEQVCEYSFKEHVIDLINNKRLIYESKPFTISFKAAYDWL